VKVNLSPRLIWMGCTTSPERTSGPFVSSSVATGGRRPSVLYSRTRAMVAPWEACEPCDMFSRATSQPASNSANSASRLPTAGPMVHTIRVLRSGGGAAAAASSPARDGDDGRAAAGDAATARRARRWPLRGAAAAAMRGWARQSE